MSKKKEKPIEVPKTFSHPFLWKHITQDDLTKLDQMTPEHVEKYIAEMMNFDRYTVDLKHGSLVDYYVTHYWWAAKQNQFTYEQISIYYSIVHVLLENLRDNHISLADNIIELKNIVTQLNQGSKVFNNSQINDIVDSVSVSLFQHYKMYEFLFFDSETDYVVSKEISVECPVPPELPYPPPLDEALPEELYNKYILKISDEPDVVQQQTEVNDESLIKSPEFTEEIENQIKTMFDGLSIEDAKRIIYEVTTEMVSDLKMDLRKTLKDKEAALVNEVSKVTAKQVKG